MQRQIDLFETQVGWEAPAINKDENCTIPQNLIFSGLQVTKMREYSNAQLAKSHENYIFQRQRLRKFSAQNYLKIRETGKYSGESP